MPACKSKSENATDQEIKSAYRKLYQLNRKKTKGDDYPQSFLAENLMLGLSNMNTCKTRLINCVQGEHVVQGSQMIFSEKPSNGTVYGEIEGDILEAEDYLPTLPNTVMKEGYNVEDHIQPRPIHINHHPGGFHGSKISADGSATKATAAPTETDATKSESNDSAALR